LPAILASWGVRSEVVEIDPAVVETARQYFAFDPRRAPVHVADGRQYLASRSDRYDYILLDAFAGELVPIHLLTREMAAELDRHLAPGGLVILNYVGYRTGAAARPLRSIVRTLGSEFPWVRALSSGSRGDFGGNVVVAGRAPAALRRGPAPFPIPAEVDSEVAWSRPMRLEGPAIVLRDDYNPLDLWALAGHEEWRREALQWMPWDVALAQ